MKHQKSCGPRLGKLVHQLLGVVTFAYDLRFRCMIARWKDLSEDYKFWMRKMIYDPCCSLFSQKTSFRASKWPWKLKTAKNSKLPKLSKTCFGPVGEGGWPPISTWINPPSLGSNGLHCVEFPGERGKRLLNLNLGDLLALLEMWHCLAC
jgi:hypothetical protein